MVWTGVVAEEMREEHRPEGSSMRQHLDVEEEEGSSMCRGDKGKSTMGGRGEDTRNVRTL